MSLKNTPETDTQSRFILDILANAITLAGYKVLDGDSDSIIVRRVGAEISDPDFEIKVNEIPV